MNHPRYNLRHARKVGAAAAEPSPPAGPPSQPDEKVKRKDFLKLLQEKFPSKFMDEKVAEESDGYETVDSVEDEEDDESIGSDDTETDESDDEDDGSPQVNIFVVDNATDDEDDDSEYDPESPTQEYLHKVNRRVTSERKFVGALPVEQQKELIAKLDQINGFVTESVPLRVKLIQSDIPDECKVIALKKMSAMRTAQDGEAHKLQYWVSSFMDIPFNKFCTLPVTIDDGVEKCQAFMEKTKDILDAAVNGLSDAKMQIMQWMGTVIANPKSAGMAIGIKGPMGTGKTTLVKEGICKALDCPFAFISLGGATDSAVMEGHNVTYEGSTWGQIVQVLMQSRCMNPVFYFDELDKVSETPKGEEIINILIHLIDSSQNDKFQDKYFAGIYFDLSKAKFIFSFNDESKISPILRDRMYMVQTEGYTMAEKMPIARGYILPKVRANVRITDEQVIFPDEALMHLIEHYTGEEKGVRKLVRCIETVFNKINLKRFDRPGKTLFSGDLEFVLTFPMTVTPDLVGKLLKREKPPANLHMYV